jgi:CRP-like cAMP-binding protein
LLAGLPSADFLRLRPHLKTRAARHKETVYHPGERIRYVYFPNGGVYSVTTVLPDGSMVEALTVGDEGMFCIEAFLHEDPVAPGQVIMQVPDTNVTALECKIFREEIATRGVLSDLVGRYAQLVVAQMMQAAACNALHHVQQRCARWLLMTHDRVHRDDFHLSHEFLAVMLGTRRPTVTVVARSLQQTGVITYRYGHVTVLDRRRLESAACPCYALMRDQFKRLMGQPFAEASDRAEVAARIPSGRQRARRR